MYCCKPWSFQAQCLDPQSLPAFLICIKYFLIWMTFFIYKMEGAVITRLANSYVCFSHTEFSGTFKGCVTVRWIMAIAVPQIGFKNATQLFGKSF